MKDALKERAIEIRTLRAEMKKLQRAGDIKASTLQFNLDYKASYQYRHMHIAYCEMRGTPYERIEPKVREGNEPDRTQIDHYKEQYSEELVHV